MFKNIQTAILAVVFCLFGISAPSYAGADDRAVEKVFTPDWVQDKRVPSAPTIGLNATSNGILYRLADHQIKWRADGYEYFTRYSYEVTDRSGLEEASRISQEFDPADTTLNFNFIRVIRNGAAVDHLHDADITVLRQEDELETGIIDGNLNAFIVLKDIKVGDVIDYGVSGQVTNKLWPGEFFDSTMLGFSVPISEIHYRLIWPKSKPLFFKSFQGAPSPTIADAGDMQDYQWDVFAPTPIPTEDDIPAWIYGWPAVEISSMAEWQDVQQWARPLYEGDDGLPKDFAKLIKDIKRQWTDPKDRMTEALRLVQDKIRYVGIEIGHGSHVPRRPQEVIGLGYGDCKDKSVLLVTILKKLGIKAWPALVDSDEGPGLLSYLPSPTAFDHAIVKAEIKGKAYWLDPTLTHQGGRGDALTTPSYAYGLPIGAKDHGLEEIISDMPVEPTQHVSEIFTFMAEGSQDLFTLDVTAVYREDEADIQRRNVASQSKDSLNRSYGDYYRGLYMGLKEVSPVVVGDDLDQNVLTINVQYALPRDAAKSAGITNAITLQAWGVRNVFGATNQTERRTPIVIPFRISRSHQTKIIVPGHRPQGGPALEKELPNVKFNRTMVASGDTLTIDMALNITARTIAPELAQQADQFTDELNKASYLTFNISKVHKSLANIFKLDETTFAPAEEIMTTALVAIHKKDHVAALQALNKLEQGNKEPTRLRGIIQTLRGQTLKALNRNSAAKDAYAEGVKLYADDADSYFKLSELYRASKEPTLEAELLTALAINLPESAAHLRQQWVGELSRLLNEAKASENFDKLALALAKSGYTGDTAWGSDWIYVRAIKALMDEGSTEQASAFLAHISEPHSLLSLMTERQYQPIWPEVEERAGKDLRLAIDRNVDIRKAAYEEDPKDLKRYLAYLSALNSAGKAETVITLAKPYVDDWDTVVAVAEDAFWIVNDYARALHSLGHFSEAEALLAKISDLGYEDFPSAVNMGINRIDMLVAQGRYEEALEIANSFDKKYASDFGNMYVSTYKACSLFMQGRTHEGAAVMVEIEDMRDKNIGAYTSAVLCSNDLDKAEIVLTERMEKLDTRSEVMQRFQTALPSPIVPPFEQEMMNRLRAVVARPSMQKVFDKYGRSIQIGAYDTHWGG